MSCYKNVNFTLVILTCDISLSTASGPLPFQGRKKFAPLKGELSRSDFGVLLLIHHLCINLTDFVCLTLSHKLTLCENDCLVAYFLDALCAV